MWKSISLSDLEYRSFNDTLEEFKNDIDKLILLQSSGNVPLILSEQVDSMYNVCLAPDTFEILSQIDSRFHDFRKEVKSVCLDVNVIDAQELLLGHKETFKKHFQKKMAMGNHFFE